MGNFKTETPIAGKPHRSSNESLQEGLLVDIFGRYGEPLSDKLFSSVWSEKHLVRFDNGHLLIVSHDTVLNRYLVWSETEGIRVRLLFQADALTPLPVFESIYQYVEEAPEVGEPPKKDGGYPPFSLETNKAEAAVSERDLAA